jgi:Right handed beta helix region
MSNRVCSVLVKLTALSVFLVSAAAAGCSSDGRGTGASGGTTATVTATSTTGTGAATATATSTTVTVTASSAATGTGTGTGAPLGCSAAADGICPTGCVKNNDPDCPDCSGAADCEDGNDSTIDRCLSGGCTHDAIAGKIYYVDPVSGDDSSGTGSASAPFKTIGRIRPQLQAGDAVLLRSGDYGAYLENQANLGFTDWVTIAAAPGADPRFTSITLQAAGSSFSGNADLYMRFVGLTATDGIVVNGWRHVEVLDCKVRRVGPWAGSAADVDKTAIAAAFTSYLLVEGCDITETGIGIQVQRSENATVRRNHIYLITQDGLEICSVKQGLVEGNRIHNMDDGVDDDSGLDWNRHGDGIQLYPIFNNGPEDRNESITIRGNIFYELDNAAIQFNSKSNAFSQNIIIENNILGPARANPFNSYDEQIDGLTLRNNSVIYIPGGLTFQSRFRTLTDDDFTVEMSGTGHTNVQIYNNIFVNDVYRLALSNVTRYDHNVCIYSPGAGSGLGCERTAVQGSLEVTDNQYLNPMNFDGVLISSSPAINAGTRTQPNGDPIVDYYNYDIYGRQRDAQPDIGAVEMP